jgi:hypothetical protein
MFNELPRYIGFPNQIFCDSKFSFDSFERTYKNKVPFFVSPFQYKDKDTPIVDNLFFDVDSYYSLRFPYRNIKQLRDFCRRIDVPYILNFSGQKGYHLFLIVKPMMLTSEASRVRIGDLMYSVQLRIAEETGIEAYDEPTFGRTRFLCRYPTSYYWRRNKETGKMEESGFYCRNLSDEEFDLGVEKLVRVVQTPGEVPKTPKATKSLQEIADLFKNFKLKHREDGNVENVVIERGGMETPTIAALGLPCLQDMVKHSHPSHFERIELVAFLKLMGYSDLAINSFIKSRNWTRYNYPTTSYQIRTVHSRMVKCSFMKKSYPDACKRCTYTKGR